MRRVRVMVRVRVMIRVRAAVGFWGAGSFPLTHIHARQGNQACGLMRVGGLGLGLELERGPGMCEGGGNSTIKVEDTNRPS